jgi:hypothetical protein
MTDRAPYTRQSWHCWNLKKNGLEISKEWMYVDLVGRQACMNLRIFFEGVLISYKGNN